MLQTLQTGSVASVEGGVIAPRVSAARQWRLVWVLRVVPGTDQRRKGRRALTRLNHVPVETRFAADQAGSWERGAMRSEGRHPGGRLPSGGRLAMRRSGVLVAPAPASRFS